MGILSIFSPSDPELVEKTLSRLAEQDTWNDVFSTKLIELLDKIDQVKHEIRERMRKADERIKKAESVVQAESRLLDEAAKAENLINKLATTELALNALRSEFLVAKNHYQGAESLRTESQEMVAAAENQFRSARTQLDSAINRCKSAIEIAADAAIASRKSSEMLKESSRAYMSATQRLDTAKSSAENAAHVLQLAEATQRMARIESEKATYSLDSARCMAVDARKLAEKANTQYHSAEEMQLKAAHLGRVSARSATLAVALSWLAMTWTGWFMVRTNSFFWTAFTLSALIVAAGIFIMRGIESDN